MDNSTLAESRLKDIESLVQEFISGGHAYHKAHNGSIIDCGLYIQRKAYINRLREVAASISSAAKKLAEELEDVTRVHAADTYAISELVNIPPDQWITPDNRDQNKKFLDAAKHGGKIGTPVKKDLTLVSVTPTSGIYARVVDSPNSVLADGCVYYLRTAGHFAVRVGPLFLHGNVGIIYDNAREPTKVKSCQYGTKCLNIGACKYYHDPLLFPGARDVRNFTNTSFIYNGSNDRRGGRKIGSKDRFDADIVQLRPEDTAHYLDQVAHDFFCAMLIAQIQKTK